MPVPVLIEPYPSQFESIPKVRAVYVVLIVADPVRVVNV